MKLKYLGVSVLLVLVFFAPASAAWQSIGPEGGKVKFVCVSPANDDVIYIGTETDPIHIWRSSDGGQTWIRKGEPYNISMYFYTMALGINEVIFVGSFYGSHRSTDQGQTWTHTTIQGAVQGYAPHPTNPLIVYATGYAISGGNYNFAFFKSTDAGLNWTTTNVAIGSNCSGFCIDLDHNNPDIIYVGGHTNYKSKVYKSTDAGANWTVLTADTTATSFNSLKVHYTNSNIILAGTQVKGIWRSTDAGLSWAKISSFNYNVSMASTPANPDLFFTGEKDTIRRTTDRGATWTKYGIGTGLTWGDYYGISISSTNANKMFASCQSGVYRSTNTGSNWTCMNNNLRAGNIQDIGMVPSAPLKMYVDFSLLCIYETTNGGDNWSVQPYYPSVCGTMCAWAINPVNPNIRYSFEGEG